MSLLVICRRCGRAFIAGRADVLAGPHLGRLCPVCRGPDPPPGASAPPPVDDACPMAPAWRWGTNGLFQGDACR